MYMKHLTIAVLLIGAITSPLSADCGWILWTNQGNTESGWTFLTPWPDLPSCQNAQEAEIGRWLQQGWKRFPKLGPNWIAREIADDGTAVIDLDAREIGTRHYQCFPAVFDPRPRMSR
jgi:hypothetical protein